MPNAVNTRIIKYRKEKNITQKEIAEKLGYKCSTYSRRERERFFSAYEVLKIAEILQIDPNLLLFDIPPEPIDTTHIDF